jgi:hypothetical protein
MNAESRAQFGALHIWRSSLLTILLIAAVRVFLGASQPEVAAALDQAGYEITLAVLEFILGIGDVLPTIYQNLLTGLQLGAEAATAG